MYPVIQLKKGKEAAVGHGHPWIFSGAIDKAEEDLTHGDLVTVLDSSGATVGVGTYSAKSSIAVRLMARGNAAIDRKWFADAFRASDARRRLSGIGATEKEGYRVAFGEADGLPGIVLDRYADVGVLQLSTAGTDRLRDDITAAAVEATGVSTLIERSDVTSRRDEGLAPSEGVLVGEATDEVRFDEDDMAFIAKPMTGQKTGFYLDQRELRSAVRGYAEGRDVLNLFSYTAATSMAAMKGGATSVTNVDASADALAGAARQAELNGIAADKMVNEEADVFQWLSANGEGEHGMVVLDPPALIKSQKDAENGRKAYHFLNRAALRLVADGGMFVTSSCSRYLSREDLEFILRRASVQSGVRLHLLSSPGQPPDHPRSVYFPESAYLASCVCLVERVR